ncbi:MAG TPA: M23 family metallopeptidase [Beijerinckiaceae bacterium]
MTAERRLGVDPGHEPALDGFGGASEVDRRGVSLRWLGASVLTALTGAALIGGAIYVAVQGETTFAELPERATAVAPRASSDDKGTAARKSDKLVRSEVVAVAKQSFRSPMTLRAGDREVIKVKSFVRIATNLSLTSGVFATDIPPFNPLRLFAEENNEKVVAQAEPEPADAEVSVVKRDLSTATIEASPAGLTDEDVAAQIEEERRAAQEAGRRPVLPLPAQLILSRTLRQPDLPPEALGFAKPIESPFNSIEVRVVPENVTTLPKHEPRPSDSPFEERDVALKRSEAFEAALKANGATDIQIAGIVNALGGRARTGALAEGQRMRLLFGPGPRPGEPRQMVRVILFGERGIEGIAAVNDRGAFVSVTPPVEEGQKKGPTAPRETDEEGEDEEGGVRLYDSLYETATKHELPRQTVEELVRIFGYDVDFQRRVANGDSVEIFYTQDEENGSDRPELLYASLNVGGEVRRVFRYQADDGSVEFFDEAGRSLKKFLMRKPIAEGELRSGFGYRRHPILGYSKMHTGVDWANRIGTPIMAAGNGTVIKAEWDSGYGRRVELQHTNGYVTAYNHMSRFGRGVAPGARVRQGQIVGYVGNTGLSTGPHLHYEVIVNGRFVDPMKIRVPRGKELDGRQLAEFKRQRDQVDGLMQKAGASTRLTEATVR